MSLTAWSRDGNWIKSSTVKAWFRDAIFSLDPGWGMGERSRMGIDEKTDEYSDVKTVGKESQK